MTREIILVTLIDGDEINIEKSKAFTDSKKADEYFVQLIKDNFSDYAKDYTQSDYDEFLDQGFWQDLTHFCVYINEIPLIED